MIPKKTWIGIAVALGMVSVLAQWSANRPTKLAENGTTIRIGAIDPLTGPFAAYDEPIRDGILPAADKSTAKRGIEGGKTETTIPNRSPSSSTTSTTTEPSIPQPSPEHSTSPREATMGGSLWKLMGDISPVISLVSLFIAWYAFRDGKRLADRLNQVGELAERLAKQIPRDLRILVPVDQSGPETGTWGTSVLCGIRTYFRLNGNTISIGENSYRISILALDDEGLGDNAKKIAQEIVSDVNFHPLAIVGPISTGCARKSLPLYQALYETNNKKALHLLPVPTDTNLLWDSELNNKLRSSCIFRMPPNNRKQAQRLMKPIISESGTEKAWRVFLLHRDHLTNEYVWDLGDRLKEEGGSIPGQGANPPVFPVNRMELMESHLEHCRAKWPANVIVVGPWTSAPEAPCVRDFIQVWRTYELKHKIPHSRILLPDFPVPDAEKEWQRSRTLPHNIYATFQATPGTLKRARELLPSSGVNDLTLFAYGYDAANLIHYAITRKGSVEPDSLINFITEMGVFPGLVQSYKFSRDDHENTSSDFHIYRFKIKSGWIQMDHEEDLCGCKPEDE